MGDHCRLEGDTWINEASAPLWGQQTSGLTGAGVNMSQNFQSLRFGAPCITKLADGMLFVAFWCYEDYVSNIRWCKFRIL